MFAIIAVAALRMLYRTCRMRIVLEAPGVNPYETTAEQRYLYCVWHDQLLMAVFGGRPKEMAGLVSAHQDGSYLAEAMKLLGIAPVRGSSKRGGSRAMRELLDRVRDYHVAITPDGPRGPRRKLKAGIVYLASRSGRVIIPTAYTCRRMWRIPGRWTDMMVPWPFTVIHARGGVPLSIPDGIERDELERYTARLEADMERLETLARWDAAGAPPWPADISRPMDRRTAA
jgi:lysophospholipid acyltransferase (LPLAT)-like uncharacterized protein